MTARLRTGCKEEATGAVHLVRVTADAVCSRLETRPAPNREGLCGPATVEMTCVVLSRRAHSVTYEHAHGSARRGMLFVGRSHACGRLTVASFFMPCELECVEAA